EPTTGSGTYDCVGLYGATCGTPIPKWRHKFRTIWSAPWNFDLVATWRHMDSVKLDATSGNPLLSGAFSTIAGSELGTRDYLDLSVTWNVWKNATLRFGVNNVFDRDPPLCDSGTACAPPFGNGN